MWKPTAFVSRCSPQLTGASSACASAPCMRKPMSLERASRQAERADSNDGQPMRSGFACIVGRPNAGKSTLLNALVGEKLAIVTHKPQTTRNRIQGFVNVKPRKGRPQGQIVFIDTPGVHKPESQLSRRMMQEVYDALEGRDLILLIVDAAKKFGTGDEFVLDLIKKSGGKVFLLLNKVDLLPKDKLLPMIADYSKLHRFDEI